MASVSFRQPGEQARHAVAKHVVHGATRRGAQRDHVIHSVGTERSERQVIKLFVSWLQRERRGFLETVGIEAVMDFLHWRAERLTQKSLNHQRRALARVTRFEIAPVHSELDAIVSSRAYTHEQVALIVAHQNTANALATRIADDAGLRGAELLSIAPRDSREPSTHRTWHAERFFGREQVSIFSVKGKGGLVREVALDNALATELESRRLAAPQIVVDREVRIVQYFDLPGGNTWASSFSAASKRVLGWSAGAHGLRHSYAQRRIRTLLDMGVQWGDALDLVSQELGHFRRSIVYCYLR